MSKRKRKSKSQSFMLLLILILILPIRKLLLRTGIIGRRFELAINN